MKRSEVARQRRVIHTLKNGLDGKKAEQSRFQLAQGGAALEQHFWFRIWPRNSNRYLFASKAASSYMFLGAISEAKNMLLNRDSARAHPSA